MTEYERKLIKSMRLEICDNCINSDTGDKCGECPVHKLLCFAEKEEK